MESTYADADTEALSDWLAARWDADVDYEADPWEWDPEVGPEDDDGRYMDTEARWALR